MNLVLGEVGEQVHRLMPGANRTLCGRSVFSIRTTSTRSPVTCRACLDQAETNERGVSNVLTRLRSDESGVHLSHPGTVFKSCACGVSYVTREDWEALPGERRECVDGRLLDERMCACGSHLTVTIVEPITLAELRSAVDVIDGMAGYFAELYTANEMLRLVRCCWLSGWQVTPKDLTAMQRENATRDGAVPRFSYSAKGDLHALGVDDCRCGACLPQPTEERCECCCKGGFDGENEGRRGVVLCGECADRFAAAEQKR